MTQTAIIFLSAHDATNAANWSGTLSSLYLALKQHNPDASLHPLDGGFLDTAAQLANRILNRLHIRIDCRQTTAFAICAGLYNSARLTVTPSGPIVAVAASNYIPYLITRRRIIYISDATFRALTDLYPDYKHIPNWLYRQMDKNEAKSLHKANAVIHSSKWASDSAHFDYGVERQKLFELPFGPNIPRDFIEKYYIPKSIEGFLLRLLFVSADWNRKGGETAIAICRALKAQGVHARLVVIGDAPLNIYDHDFVEYKGFLKKSNPDHLSELCREYNAAHFLLVPSIAEAFGIVSIEAQAFGVPPVSWDVGGIPSAIAHNKTGLLLPEGSSADYFAKAMMPYIQDAKLYDALSLRCREWYSNRANWVTWTRMIARLSNS
jgi:glycosyltransferase involved in cell wall biosynthesis